MQSTDANRAKAGVPLPELRRQLLGWTILQRSCELAHMACELGDRELAGRFRCCALHVAPVVGATRGLVKRIERDLGTDAAAKQRIEPSARRGAPSPRRR